MLHFARARICTCIHTLFALFQALVCNVMSCFTMSGAAGRYATRREHMIRDDVATMVIWLPTCLMNSMLIP